MKLYDDDFKIRAILKSKISKEKMPFYTWHYYLGGVMKCYICEQDILILSRHMNVEEFAGKINNHILTHIPKYLVSFI